MPSPDDLVARLDAISQSVATTGRALALIGLGSAGKERQRLDLYSDLDFFVIASDGSSSYFLDDLAWLARPAPLAYVFRNTADSYKVLSADGIFYEFAIFEQVELRGVPFAAERVVWKSPGFDEALAVPQVASIQPASPPVEWLIGEALTNLYVGLGRYQRGEKLSAMRFIQQYAVDRVLELAAHLEEAQSGPRDPFSPERRVEQRFPTLAQQLPMFTQGYGRSRESARAILDFLAQYVALNPAMADAIRARC